MDIITNTITTIVAKPSVGIGATSAGGFAAFLSWCGVITQVGGALSVIIAITIGILHIYYFVKAKHKKEHIDYNDL
jgi:hypothetical protein